MKTFSEFIKNLNVLTQKLAKKKLTILTVMTFIFPVFPLMLASFWSFYFILPNILFVQAPSLSRLINSLLFMTWAAGGVTGLVAIIQLLRGRRTKITLALYLHASIAYSLIAVVFMLDLLHTGSFESILFVAYLIITLFVIATHLVRLHTSVFSTGTVKKEMSIWKS